MARGRRSSVTVELSASERTDLEHLTRSTNVKAGLARRARIVLLRAEGVSISEISRRVGVKRRAVYKWLDRHKCKGMRGLGDKPRPGRPRVFSPDRGVPFGQIGLREAG